MTRNRHGRSLRFSALLLGVVLAATAAASPVPPLARETEDGFSVPQPGRPLVFPADHGSHPDYRIEWWYLTGHLFGPGGRRFGFQATFFRSALRRVDAAGAGPASATAAFGESQLYLAHMSLLDAARGRFLHEERINRDGWDADAAIGRLDLRNGNWSLAMTDPEAEHMRLAGSVRAEAVFDVELVPEKPKVVFGQDGVSRKGADPTAASLYITFTRLAVKGTLRIDGQEIAVEGRAWMDHEISSSQLSAGQVGWDWCSLQLDDGWDVMAYRLRRADGSSDPFSTLAWVSPAGAVTHVPADGFAWEPIEHWTSPETGARYPVRYRVRTRPPAPGGREVVLEIRAVAPNQELTGALGGIAYWEGACDVLDEAGKPIGRGYTELTGYAESLQGRF